MIVHSKNVQMAARHWGSQKRKFETTGVTAFISYLNKVVAELRGRSASGEGMDRLCFRSGLVIEISLTEERSQR